MGALPTSGRAEGAYVLPVPPVGGIAHGLAGTTDPATLAQAQLFDVRLIVSLDEETGTWLWYVPGAPAFVNTLTGRLRQDSRVLIARSASLAERLAPLGTLAVQLRSAAHSAMIAISDDERWLYVANIDSGTVSVIDTDAGVRVSEIRVGAEPRSIALDPRGARAYVTSFADDTISVVDLVRREVIDRVATLRRPYGLVVSPDGATLFVAESAASTVGVYATDSMRRSGVIRVEPNPRGLAISAAGARLYVTHFLSGRVSVVDVESSEVVAVIGTGGESNAAQFIAIHPSGAKAYLPHIRSRVSNPSLQFDSTIAPLVSVIDLPASALLRKELLGLDAIDQPVNMPFAVAFSPDGRLIYVVNSGSNDLSIVDLETGIGAGHIDVGDNPRGIVLTVNGARAYVLNALSDDVSVLDLVSKTEVSRIAVTESPLPPQVRRGKALFFSSDRTELARDQWVSCASCHLDGLSDGRTWPFDDGPRNTPVILGLASSPPFHWSGDRVDLFDFQKTIIGLQGGTGISDQEIADLAAFLGFGVFNSAQSGGSTAR